MKTPFPTPASGSPPPEPEPRYAVGQALSNTRSLSTLAGNDWILPGASLRVRQVVWDSQKSDYPGQPVKTYERYMVEDASGRQAWATLSQLKINHGQLDFFAVEGGMTR